VSKSVLVGTYTLGYDNVRIELDGDTAGGAAAIWYNPADGGCQKIVMSCKGRSWADGVSSLLHEAMESMMHRRGMGYYRAHTLRETTDGYMFLMSHLRFSECCDWMGSFLAACLPDLSAAWRKINKKG
jgi:hypothetical protein